MAKIRRAAAVSLFWLILTVSGCHAERVNESFGMSRADAKRALDAMAKEPAKWQRPIVVLGGYHDPGIGAGVVCDRLRRLSGGQRVIGVSYFFSGTFDDCRKRVIDAVESEFPSDDPQQT